MNYIFVLLDYLKGNKKMNNSTIKSHQKLTLYSSVGSSAQDKSKNGIHICGVSISSEKLKTIVAVGVGLLAATGFLAATGLGLFYALRGNNEHSSVLGEKNTQMNSTSSPFLQSTQQVQEGLTNYSITKMTAPPTYTATNDDITLGEQWITSSQIPSSCNRTNQVLLLDEAESTDPKKKSSVIVSVTQRSKICDIESTHIFANKTTDVNQTISESTRKCKINLPLIHKPGTKVEVRYITKDIPRLESETKQYIMNNSTGPIKISNVGSLNTTFTQMNSTENVDEYPSC